MPICCPEQYCCDEMVQIDYPLNVSSSYLLDFSRERPDTMLELPIVTLVRYASEPQVC